MVDFKLCSLFNKYMKVPDPDKAHAVLSASGSERWLGCPASIRLSAGRPRMDNEHNIAGTHAHTLLQFILENPQWKRLLSRPEAIAFKKFIGFSNEQLASVLVAASYIAGEYNRMYRITGKFPQMFIEQKLKLDGIGFGTTDVILYQPFGLLHIMDYKNGKYKVEPEDNTQGLYYGVAAADKFGWDFREIWISILQPNAPHKRGLVRTWKTTPERLEKARLMFLRGAALTEKKNAPVIPNHKYCWFCPARSAAPGYAGCPAHVEDKREKIVSRFER